MLTVILVQPGTKDFFGSAIAKLTNDPICHVGVDLGENWAVAEESQGFWARPIEQYGSQCITFPLAALSGAQEAQVRQSLKRLVGTPYDFKQIGIDLLDRLHAAALGHLLQARHDHGERASYVCSGVIAAVCADAGYKPFGDEDPRSVTPADWHKLYLSSGAVPV